MDWHAPEATTVFQYLESSLPETELQAFEAHLQECRECRRELEAARRLEDLSRNWSEEDPPQQLLERIRHQLRPQTPARVWLLAAAAAAVLVLSLRLSLPQAAPEPDRLGVATPPPLAVRITRNVSEHSPQRPLAAENIWTTENTPSVIALGGQILTLGAHSHLAVRSHQGNHYVLRLSQGEVRVQEHGESIAVETEHLRVEPLGTDYQVVHKSQSSLVHLLAGEVAVTSLRTGQVARLQPGQSVEFPPPGRPRPPLAQPQPTATPALPALAYPQRAPVPAAPVESPVAEPTPSQGPLWTEQPESWRPQPEFRNPNPERPGQMPYRNPARPGQMRPWQRPGRTQGPVRRGPDSI